MVSPPTRAQIIADVLALKPLKALDLKPALRLALVRTPVYDSVTLASGEVKPLNRGANNRYAVCYIRVSTVKAKEEGFSAPEQAEALIDRCISDGRSFCVVSDAGLSGGLPYENQDLIDQFRETKADMYSTVFHAVFLARPEQESEENLARMNAYLTQHLREIKNGGYNEIFDLLPEEEEAKKGKARKPKWFRAGLTTIVESLENIDRLYITDLTRLSRSELLMANLLPLFRRHKITVVGIYQVLEFLNDRHDLGAKILVEVYTHMAEKTRFDQLLGNLRGTRQRLASGIANSKGPDWLIREGDQAGKVTDRVGSSTNKNAKAVINETQAKVVRRIIDIYLSSDKATLVDAINTVNGEGSRNRFGKKFNLRQAGLILDNPALIGYHQVFGKWWPVFPPLIEQDVWERVQEKRVGRRADHKRRTATITPGTHLMVGLLRCQCGYMMVGEKNAAGYSYYACRNPVSRLGHARLSQPEVDGFFDAFLGGHSEEVIDVLAAHTDSAALEAERLQLEETHLKNEAARTEEKARRRATLVPWMAGRVPEGSTAFTEALAVILASQTEDLDAEAKAEQEAIARVRGIIKEMRHPEDFAALKKVTKTWEELSVPQRNKILKEFFVSITIEGEAPNERLIALFKLGGHPAIGRIPVEAKRHGRSYIRTLPRPIGWIPEITVTVPARVQCELQYRRGEKDFPLAP